MEYTQLGRTGLRVSRICLGTMNFGVHTEEADSHAIMDRAIDEGINFFDTANVYGWGENRGRTETYIGNWFTKDQSRRDRTVLATKVYGGMGDWPNEDRLSALNIRRACEASLRRLQSDHIDLYQFHHIDRNTPWEEIWQACETLVTQGKVLYFGSSNFAGWHIADAQAAAAKRNFLGLVSEQSVYNLARRHIELEVLPACQHYGLGVIPYSPLDGGLLGGILRQRGGTRRYSKPAQNRVEQYRDSLAEYEDLCDEIGQEPGTVALAWLLAQPAVTAPIVGPRTMDQLERAVDALSVTIDSDVMSRLDELFPGYRTAPEHYAW
jgi:aryl-alcohol dehydrogenase-like predicted oxidoreductase